MESIQNYPMQYPVFEADQVLTNDDLNEMFDYLDDQERLTRIKLIGIGIVCGLELQHDSNNTVIRISKGCGITSWGYLITLDAIDLKYYQPYSIPSNLSSDDQYIPFTNGAGKVPLYELLSAEEYDKLSDSSKATALSADPNFLQDKVVALYLELNPDDLKNCLTGDCDNKGINMELAVKRLLVAKDSLQSSVVINSIGQILSTDDLPDLLLQRINVPATSLPDFNSIFQAYAGIFNTAVPNNIIDQLSAALEKQYQFLKPLLTEFPASPFTSVKDILLNKIAAIQKNIPYGIQYFYDFIDDLIKAYNELKTRSHQLISECCPDENKFPLHLKLGLATANTAGAEAAFREYFIYSPLFSQQQESIEEIRLLFRKIKLMIDNFFVPSSFNNNLNIRLLLSINKNLPIKITPSSIGKDLFSRRAIPYYYQINNSDPIQNSWDYNKTRAGKANENLSYNANRYNTLPDGEPYITPLLYDIEPYNFFRVEGHIGQNYYNALKEITRQKNLYRLPFDVVALKLGTDAADIQPDITCSFSDLESQYDILKSDWYCQLGEQICYYASQPYNSSLLINFAHEIGLITKDFVVNNKVAPKKSSSKKAAAKKAARPIKAAERPVEKVSAQEVVNKIDVSKFMVNSLHADEVLKYTSFLPVNLRNIFQLNVYIKGQFLSSRPCFATIQTPAANTTNVGLLYLAQIKKGSIPNYTPANIQFLSDYLVKMTDDIEDVISTIFFAQLGYLDIDNCVTKYQALNNYAAALLTLVNQSAAAGSAIPAGLIDHLTRISKLCNIDKLKALQQEYQSRMKKLQHDLLFNNFITKHPGIDHKAGVPKGGTFILVYYEKPVTAAPPANTVSGQLVANIGNAAALQKTVSTLSANTNANININTATKSSALSGNVFKQLHDIVQDKQYAFTTDQKNLLLKFINKKLPAAAATDFQLPDKGVIADFYLPYLCCGCSGGITYVFPPEQTENNISISIKPAQFCNNDQQQYAITVQPEGGIVSGDGVTKNADKFLFSPNGLSAGAHVLSYKSDDNIATVSVNVQQALPQPDFGFQFKPNDKGATVMFFPNVAPGADLQSRWDFGDNTTADVLTPPPHNYIFDENEHTFTVTLKVSSGPCSSLQTKQVVVNKAQQITFVVSPNQFLFNDKNNYPLTISPMVTQENIVTQTNDPKQLANPDKLNLQVKDNVLLLAPAMPQLAKTFISTLQYQNIEQQITIIKPAANFTIDIKSSGAPVAQNIITLQFSALQKNATRYLWSINGNTKILQASADPKIITMQDIRKALGQFELLEIILEIRYTLNNVNAADRKATRLNLDQIKKLMNKGPKEPEYL